MTKVRLYSNTPESVALARAALRRINLEIRWHGLDHTEIKQGMKGTFLPHLRQSDEILALQKYISKVIDPAPVMEANEFLSEMWAEPQILLRFPDEEPWPIPPHLDEVPDWAIEQGRTSYRAICSVALTDADVVDGCLIVDGDGKTTPIPVRMGDVTVMDPDVWHASGRNLGPSVRYILYYRLLSKPS